MKNGQGGYKLETHGARVGIPWIIATAGWAIFFHQPFGTFDFTGSQSKFAPASENKPFPLDIFFVASRDPATIMAEYARLTGHAELPPLWSLGYQQSHRTLASRDEVLAEGKTFREKKLPCDTLIYLGTGFCPSGWNTENGSFSWNSRVFPDPRQMIDDLHRNNFRVVLHDVILTDRLSGTVHDACRLSEFDEANASCYWDAHRKDFATGVDGWWPDEGDTLDIPSRLTRNRMHWEGPQLDRPDERPYALHRNGYAGMQRFASFLWSGDVFSKWETLKTQVPIAINTSLTAFPIGEPISAVSFLRQNSRPNCICDGFSSRPFARCSAPTGGHGNYAFLGDGTLGIPVRSRQADMKAGHFRVQANCTTSRWNRSAGNIWSFDIECFPTSTASCASARSPGYPLCEHYGCTIQTIRTRSNAKTSISGAAIS